MTHASVPHTIPNVASARIEHQDWLDFVAKRLQCICKQFHQMYASICIYPCALATNQHEYTSQACPQSTQLRHGQRTFVAYQHLRQTLLDHGAIAHECNVRDISTTNGFANSLHHVMTFVQEDVAALPALMQTKRGLVHIDAHDPLTLWTRGGQVIVPLPGS